MQINYFFRIKYFFLEKWYLIHFQIWIPRFNYQILDYIYSRRLDVSFKVHFKMWNQAKATWWPKWFMLHMTRCTLTRKTHSTYHFHFSIFTLSRVIVEKHLWPHTTTDDPERSWHKNAPRLPRMNRYYKIWRKLEWYDAYFQKAWEYLNIRGKWGNMGYLRNSVCQSLTYKRKWPFLTQNETLILCLSIAHAFVRQGLQLWFPESFKSGPTVFPFCPTHGAKREMTWGKMSLIAHSPSANGTCFCGVTWSEGNSCVMLN